MLWYKILQNTICCGKLAFTTYLVYRLFSTGFSYQTSITINTKGVQ